MTPRRQVVSLNGRWQLVFDPKNVGKKQEWFRKFPSGSVRINVPGVWEQVKPGYDGVGWYRTSFDAAPDWKGKTVRLKVGAACYYAECWLNGRYLGSHEGGFTPFIFTLSPHLRSGANDLVVRIINPPINEELEGFRAGAPLNQGSLPVGKNAWYFNFGGIWQDVELIVTDPVYVEDCFVQPHPFQKKAVIVLEMRNKNRAATYEVSCTIAPKTQPEAVVSEVRRRVFLAAGVNTVSLTAKFSDVHLWSDTDPFLYTATASVAGDDVSDSLSVTFGMREFTIAKGQFLLNRKPVILNGFLQQGVYPRTLAFPESREFAARELKLLKDHGFNFMRVHLKPAPSFYLDLADEIGILILEEPPMAWIARSPETEKRCVREVTELLRRDRNHPSIVFWCLLNEAYHFRSFTIPQVRRLVKKLGAVGRKTDATRLLLDTSGGLGNRLGDWSEIMLPYTTKTAKMIDLHKYCQLPPTDADIVSYRQTGRRGIVFLNSEYGAPQAEPDYEEVIKRYTPAERKLGLEDCTLHQDFLDSLSHWFRQGGLQNEFGSVKEFIRQVNELRADEIRLILCQQRANPRQHGICFCQLADASGEIFGATDIWRRPKEVFRQMATAAATPLIVPEVMPRLTLPGKRLSARVTVVAAPDGSRTMRWRCFVAKGDSETVEIGAGDVEPRARVTTVWKGSFPAPGKPGACRLVAELNDGERLLSRQDISFRVLPEPSVVPSRVACVSPDSVLSDWFRTHRVEVDRFSNNYRDKNVPIIADCRVPSFDVVFFQEVMQQARKCSQLGGCLVLLQPETMLFHNFVFPGIIHFQPVMRMSLYAKRHRVLENLPTGCLGYEYAELYPNQRASARDCRWDKGADIVAMGGEVIAGGFSSHMWTRPADYRWGAALWEMKLGRGKVVVCQFRLIDNLASNPVAGNLLANLANYAAESIKTGYEEYLLSRCIDPIPDAVLRKISRERSSG